MWRWFDPRGRCNNGEYVRTALVASALAAPLVALLALDGVPAFTRLAATGGLWLVTGLMWLIAIRRAHDEDYPAREAHAWMGGPTLLLITWITLPAAGMTLPWWGLIMSFCVALLWCYVGIYAVAHAGGSAQPNRFGPPTVHRRGGREPAAQ